MYVSGPVAALVFLLTANVPLALVTLVPAVIAFAVLARLFRTVKGIMPRASRAAPAPGSPPTSSSSRRATSSRTSP